MFLTIKPVGEDDRLIFCFITRFASSNHSGLLQKSFHVATVYIIQLFYRLFNSLLLFSQNSGSINKNTLKISCEGFGMPALKIVLSTKEIWGDDLLTH